MMNLTICSQSVHTCIEGIPESEPTSRSKDDFVKQSDSENEAMKPKADMSSQFRPGDEVMLIVS